MKSLKSLLMTSAVLVILASACTPAIPIPTPTASATEFFDPFNPPTVTPTETLIPFTPSAKIAQSNASRDLSPSVPLENLQMLVRGNNTFAFDLYQSMREQDGNLFFSPYSISLALAMSYAGARGETESQMAKALYFDLPQDQLHPAFNKLALRLEENNASAGEDLDLELRVANSLWAQNSYPFRQEFLDTIATNYESGVRLVDFINNFNPLRVEINAWVEEQTNHRIRGILPENALDSRTRMVLVNAIYFKADWFNDFTQPLHTWDEPFYLLDGSTIDVPIMHQGLWNFNYAKGTGWQAIELPYVGFTTSMTIIVPDQGNFESFEKEFDISMYENILRFMRPDDVYLGLPKFAFTRHLDMVEQLTKMGMSDAFDRNRANFSGITEEYKLMIDDILHQAHIAVDEEGTEAAASTAVNFIEVSGEPVLDIELIIDRPFIFIIRDTINGQILFIGRVLNPAQ